MLRTAFVRQYIVTLIALLYGSLCLSAQDLRLEVKSFSIEENSLTAKNNPVYDNNQQKCALVIISGMGDEQLSFNCGNTFNKVEEKSIDGKRVYLMWVPEGVVKVSISSKSNPEKFESVDYFFNPRVKKTETYLMSLELHKLSTAIGKQYLEFVVEPTNAYIEVNDEPWTVTGGIAYKQLPKGTYSYRIQSKYYYTESGVIDFKDLSMKKSIEIKLKPNFGWLNLTSTLQGVTVFIDDEIFSGNLSNIQLPSGLHSVRATKEMYLPFSKHIEIKDNEEIYLAIELQPNFSNVKLSVPNDVSIYLDDNYLTNGSWSGNLSVGKYKVELKQFGHESFTDIIEVPMVGKTYNHVFKALTPITGSVNIESIPSKATVSIDGKKIGDTPLYLSEIQIGGHNIELKLSNYEVINRYFTVEKDKQTNLFYELEKKEDEYSVYIDSEPSGADVYVDNLYKGKTPLTIEHFTPKKHNFVLIKTGYENYSREIDISQLSYKRLLFALEEVKQQTTTSNYASKEKTSNNAKKTPSLPKRTFSDWWSDLGEDHPEFTGYIGVGTGTFFLNNIYSNLHASLGFNLSWVNTDYGFYFGEGLSFKASDMLVGVNFPQERRYMWTIQAGGIGYIDGGAPELAGSIAAKYNLVICNHVALYLKAQVNIGSEFDGGVYGGLTFYL